MYPLLLICYVLFLNFSNLFFSTLYFPLFYQILYRIWFDETVFVIYVLYNIPTIDEPMNYSKLNCKTSIERDYCYSLLANTIWCWSNNVHDYSEKSVKQGFDGLCHIFRHDLLIACLPYYLFWSLRYVSMIEKCKISTAKKTSPEAKMVFCFVFGISSIPDVFVHWIIWMWNIYYICWYKACAGNKLDDVLGARGSSGGGGSGGFGYGGHSCGHGLRDGRSGHRVVVAARRPQRRWNNIQHRIGFSNGSSDESLNKKGQFHVRIPLVSDDNWMIFVQINTIESMNNVCCISKYMLALTNIYFCC